MREVICSKCGGGTGIYRDDDNFLHIIRFMKCKKCEEDKHFLQQLESIE